jgi:hypothetical protein
VASDPIKILIVDADEDVLIELERLREGAGYASVTGVERARGAPIGKAGAVRPLAGGRGHGRYRRLISGRGGANQDLHEIGCEG